MGKMPVVRYARCIWRRAYQQVSGWGNPSPSRLSTEIEDNQRRVENLQRELDVLLRKSQEHGG